MRRILLDDDSGGGNGDDNSQHADLAAPPQYARPHALRTDDASLPPLPPTAPRATPSRRRVSSSSCATLTSENTHRRQKHQSSSNGGTGGTGGNATGSSSASPRGGALEPPSSTPSNSAAIAAALGNNVSVVSPSPSDSASNTNMRDITSRSTATMLSDSASEKEIAAFGTILDDMLARVTRRELVNETAEYMKTYPQHSLRFQLKIKQRAFCESARQFQAKLMLFYVLHEFLKSYQNQGDALRNIQRQWFQTVDEILHACVRDSRPTDDGRKRIFKTLARWEELRLYTQKIKGWKSLVLGDVKPRRAPIRLPRNDAERLAEVPDQLQQFPPPPSQLQLQIDRSTYPFLFERSDFVTQFERKQHWRFTAIAFIDVLAQCLLLPRDVALTASLFFHCVFDRGIYKLERFKVAAACLFLAAKASSKRMKLLRMVKTMHEILETPLMVGDEEILEIERMQLLYYEIEVLQAIDFELTTELPDFYLRKTLEQMPDKFRQDVSDDAQIVLLELFWVPLCRELTPQLLADAAAYIACRNNDRVFTFKWCQADAKGVLLSERTAKDVLNAYRALIEWKKGQRISFETLCSTAGCNGGTGNSDWSVKQVFQPQQGGLRIDATLIPIPTEFTQKGANESHEILRRASTNSRTQRSSSREKRSSHSHNHSHSRSRYEGDDERTGRSSSSRYDDRDRDRDRERSSRERERSRTSSSSVRYEPSTRTKRRDASRDRSSDRQQRPRERDRSPLRHDDDESKRTSSSSSRYRSRERTYAKERTTTSTTVAATMTTTSRRRSHSASPRSSSSRKRKRTERASSKRRSASRSPSRSPSRERSSRYYARNSSSNSNNRSSGKDSRDNRSNYKSVKSDRKPTSSSNSSSSRHDAAKIKREPK